MRRLIRKIRSEWWLEELRRRGILFGKSLNIDAMPVTSGAQDGGIQIGDRVSLLSKSQSTALGTAHPIILRLLARKAEIQIGNDSGLSGATICAALSVRIGRECLIGSGATIVDTDFHPLASPGRRYEKNPDLIGSAPVVIADNVFLGYNCIVLKGVTIGENSVIGAGSVVAKSIPPGCIAAGNPCRVIRQIGNLERVENRREED